jgi:hypothetical protein
MPRPGITQATITATQGQALNVAIAASITLADGSKVNVWSGVGPAAAPNGGDVFTGVGAFGGISMIEEGTTVFARGIVLSLSGFNTALLSDVINNYAQGMPVTVYLLINGTPITAWTGRTDQPKVQVLGDKASISISCENRLVEMNTSATQFRYTSECQNIFYPNDRAFDATSFIAQSTLYWGRTPGATNIGIPTGS